MTAFIFTDGSIKYNTNIGSFCYLIKYPSGKEHVRYGIIQDSTSQKSELTAGYMALNDIYLNSKELVSFLVVVTDSLYLINSVRSGLGRYTQRDIPIEKNREIVIDILKLVKEIKNSKMDIVFNHVRSHLSKDKHEEIYSIPEMSRILFNLEGEERAIFIAYLGKIIPLDKEREDLQSHLSKIVTGGQTTIFQFEKDLLLNEHQNKKLQNYFNNQVILHTQTRQRLSTLPVVFIRLERDKYTNAIIEVWEKNKFVDTFAKGVFI